MLYSSAEILLWMFGELSFNALSWAFLTVWAGVWAYHWRLETEEGQPTVETLGIRRVYRLRRLRRHARDGRNGVGGRHLRHPARRVRVRVHAARPGGDPGRALGRGRCRNGLALAIVGGAGWWAHYLYFARGEARSVIRQAYLFAVRARRGIRNRGGGPGHPAVRPARLADRSPRGGRGGRPFQVPDGRDRRAERRSRALAVPPDGRCGARRTCLRWARRRPRGSTPTSPRPPVWPS